MTEQEFRRLADQGYNRIPLVVETFADLDTPLSVYLKLANEPYTYLLESVQGGERFGRYSFIGLPRANPLRGASAGRAASIATARVTRRDRARRSARVRARTYLRALQGRRPRRTCRASAAVWSATSATTPCATSSNGSPRRRRRMRSARPTSCCCSPSELAVVDNLSGKLYLVVYCRSARAGRLRAGAGAAGRTAFAGCGTGRNPDRTARAARHGVLRVRRGARSWPPSSGRSATSSTATSCRWCCRSA